MRISGDDKQLVIEPPGAYYVVGYGYLALIGGAALLYAGGILLFPAWPKNIGFLEKAVYAFLPLLFAATLAWWALGDRQTFRFDRTEGLLFDGPHPLLSLTNIAAITVRPDDGETCTFYAIDLTLLDGRSIPLRRNLWPMDTDPSLARAKAQIVAEFLGIGVEPAAANPR